MNEAMPDIELSQALVWLLNYVKTIINHEVYARRDPNYSDDESVLDQNQQGMPIL